MQGPEKKIPYSTSVTEDIGILLEETETLHWIEGFGIDQKRFVLG